jgi:hypothetical protein
LGPGNPATRDICTYKINKVKVVFGVVTKPDVNLGVK